MGGREKGGFPNADFGARRTTQFCPRGESSSCHAIRSGRGPAADSFQYRAILVALHRKRLVIHTRTLLRRGIAQHRASVSKEGVIFIFIVPVSLLQ